MDRRAFLLSSLAVAGCGPIGARRVAVVCDPTLEPALRTVLADWTKGGGAYDLDPLPAKALLVRAESSPGLLVVTREDKLADRLQRLGHVRLNNRWKVYHGDSPVHLVATMGAGERDAVRLGKWLAGEEAAPYWNATPTPVIFSAP